MRQVVVFRSLLAASPQQSNGGLGGAIQDIVNGALKEARSELNAKLNELTSQRADLQVDLATPNSAAERARLLSRIERIDAQIRETSDALAKLETGVSRTNRPTTTFPSVGTPPQLPNFP